MPKKYLEFEPIVTPADARTRKWRVRNLEGFPLGNVEWKVKWRKYVFIVLDSFLLFDHHCLREIADFTESETKARMAACKARKEAKPNAAT